MNCARSSSRTNVSPFRRLRNRSSSLVSIATAWPSCWMPSRNSSMIPALRAVVVMCTIAGRGRASSPAPEGEVSLIPVRPCCPAIHAAPQRLAQSAAHFGPPTPPVAPDADPVGARPAAAGLFPFSGSAAAFLSVRRIGRAGRPGTARAWPGAGPNPLCLRVAPGMGAGCQFRGQP